MGMQVYNASNTIGDDTVYDATMAKFHLTLLHDSIALVQSQEGFKILAGS